MPLPSIQLPATLPPPLKGLPKLAGDIVGTALNIAGLAEVGTLRILQRFTGNVIFDGYFQYKDSNGVTRWEFGNLPANGNSPAQQGARANNAGGVPIFDTLGLIDVETAIGSSVSQPWSPSTLTGTTTPTGITGTNGEVTITSANFTLTRTLNVLVLASCAAAGWVTVGPIALAVPIYVRITGHANGASGAVSRSTTAGSTTFPTTATVFQQISLPAGSYTANLIWNSVAGTSDRLDVYAYNLYVFQKGS